LASYETPEEISSNDAILASRANILVDEAQLFDFNARTKTLKQQKSMTGLKDLKKHQMLGRGGFGKVWLVESKTSRTPYALKQIHKRKLLDAKQERSVMREKEVLNLLHHPFILYMLSSFQDAINLYLRLPLIQGGELFNVVAAKAKSGQGIPNDNATFYAGGIIEALGHFHHHLIAYQDLKFWECDDCF
jgi:serine/threonine protein kinase